MSCPSVVSACQFSALRETADAEVVGVVDGRLGSERAAFLEVLLDLGVLVVRLDLRLGAAMNDAGAEPSRGAGDDLAAERDLHVVGAPERELVGDHQLEPVAARGRLVEHAGVGDLELADRERVAVAAQSILGGERRREQRLPALPEPLDLSLGQRVADLGQRELVIDRAKAVVERLEGDRRGWSACCLAHSCPLR